MAQAGVKPYVKASRLKPGWWIVGVPDGQQIYTLHGFFSWAHAMSFLAMWFRSRPMKLPVNG